MVEADLLGLAEQTLLGGLIGSGVTAAELVEEAEVPAELVAVTVNVTRLPLASEGTIAQWLGSLAVIVCPVDAVTSNELTGAPSTVAGLSQWTVAEPEPASAVTCVGTSAGPPGAERRRSTPGTRGGRHRGRAGESGGAGQQGRDVRDPPVHVGLPGRRSQ